MEPKQIKFIEAGADLEHDRWARWMQYLFSCCKRNPNGSMTIPPSLAQRWERQCATKYNDLPENEKESDRKEVRKYLPLLEERW